MLSCMHIHTHTHSHICMHMHTQTHRSKVDDLKQQVGEVSGKLLLPKNSKKWLTLTEQFVCIAISV